ncbi:unnamed protein product [Cylindrotheca closterium]|uniref:Uncharacterized protein n=1 Tax=Cylindrotheca closterium TaxID=2856 RepID=A0AAD2FWE3_9STRA|nr:unnamed protein product [Cylindrotheca closterium]
MTPTWENDGPVMTPAQQRRAKEAERKRKMDLENNVPSPLFIMVLPGEMEGTYLFISRLKYVALATNVLNGLLPFFTHHLGELTTTQANRVIAKWLSMSLIHTTHRKELVWCLETLWARPSDQTLQGIDEAIDFLDGFGSDPLDVGEAMLEFDMEMADAKDIDDGAAVAGNMDELLEKDSQLEAAITEIEFKDNLLNNWHGNWLTPRTDTQPALSHANTNRSTVVESMTPDPAERSSTNAEGLPVEDSISVSGTDLPSVTEPQVSGNSSEASIFPIFRHSQSSPPSVPVKGKRGRKKASTGRGAGSSTAGP